MPMFNFSQNLGAGIYCKLSKFLQAATAEAGNTFMINYFIHVLASDSINYRIIISFQLTSFSTKLLKSSVIIFGFTVISLSVCGYFVCYAFYRKLNRYITDNNKNRDLFALHLKWIAKFYLRSYSFSSKRCWVRNAAFIALFDWGNFVDAFHLFGQQF